MLVSQKSTSPLTSNDWLHILEQLDPSALIKKSVLDKVFHEIAKTREVELLDEYNVRGLYHVWDALLAWRDQINQSNMSKSTKKNYISWMSALLDQEVIKPDDSLTVLTKDWQGGAETSIDSLADWSLETKRIRKVALSKFLEFVETFSPQFSSNPPRNIPPRDLIHHVLTSMEDKVTAQSLSAEMWDSFLEHLGDSNPRDYVICHVVLYTGHTVREVLDLKGSNVFGSGIKWNDGAVSWIPKDLQEILEKVSNDSLIFRTSEGKQIRQNQLVRAMKKSSKALGLEIEITPKILHGWAVSLLEKDRRSLLQKCLDDVTIVENVHNIVDCKEIIDENAIEDGP